MSPSEQKDVFRNHIYIIIWLNNDKKSCIVGILIGIRCSYSILESVISWEIVKSKKKKLMTHPDLLGVY